MHRFSRADILYPHEPTLPALSVVIPAYNEAGRIAPFLDSIQRYLTRYGEPHEVLVVNDGSTDGTAALVRARMARDPTLGLVRYSPNRGKGHAVRTGMCAARGKLRLFADADGSTPIEELARLRTALKSVNADVVVGSRVLAAPGVHRAIPPYRSLISEGFRWLRKSILDVGVADSQCGFKLFTGAVADLLFRAARLDGFAFDVEVLYLAARAGLQVVEVPVNWHDSGSTRVDFIRDPLRMIRDILVVQRLHRTTVLHRDAPASAHSSGQGSRPGGGS